MSGVAVMGLGLFTPGFADTAAFFGGAADPEVTRAEAACVDRRSKRRASGIMRALADAWWQAALAGDVAVATAPAVFGSALGEASTMITLLDQMWREGGDLSPMRFSLSVHNAASGMVSIGAKNHGFTTSLSADYDTPAMVLAEAIGLVESTGGPVVLVCGDEASPADLVPVGEEFGLLTGALALGPAGAGGALARLSGLRLGAAGTSDGAALSPALARNPQAGIVDLIAAVFEHRAGRVRLDRGRGRGWSVEVSAA